MKLFILLCMIFCHILDDYKIQAGVLNNLKQRRWWESNSPEPKYRHDYIAGLVMHSLSWSFMVLLPVAVYSGFDVSGLFLVIYLVNAAVHAYVDDLKANRGKINLLQDQAIHILQIVISFIILV